MHLGYYASRNDKDEPVEIVKALGNILAGLQYWYQLKQLPLSWTGTVEIGGTYYYETGPKRYGPYIDPSESETIDDYGSGISIRTGLLCHLSQAIGFFGEAG